MKCIRLRYQPLFTHAVTTVDTVPPVINGCPGPITQNVALGTTSTIVSWTEPTATDNSGVTPAVTRSHQPGESFPIGTTIVRYTFTDQAGNSEFCSFDIRGKQSTCANKLIEI